MIFLLRFFLVCVCFAPLQNSAAAIADVSSSTAGGRFDATTVADPSAPAATSAVLDVGTIKCSALDSAVAAALAVLHVQTEVLYQVK